MLLRRSHGLSIAEVWFDETPPARRVDILRYHQAFAPVPGAVSTPFYTLVVDLTRSEVELWNDLRKDTRYEVRRAREKDDVTRAVWDGADDDVLVRFRSAYDAFAQQKGLALLPWDRIRCLAGAGILDVSWAGTAAEGNLVYHAHVVIAGRARLLQSASLFRASSDSGFRNLVGRANRLLHWEDILRFRTAGVRTYDFGGWYEGKDDEERLRINAFKEGFGGRLEKNWNAELFVSGKARVAASLARHMRSLVKLLGAGRSTA